MPAASAADVEAVPVLSAAEGAPEAAVQGVPRVVAGATAEAVARTVAGARQVPVGFRPAKAAVPAEPLASGLAARTPAQSTPHLAEVVPKVVTRPRPGR